MGASLGSGSSKQPEPEINVTPLVDVVLVLLIIFMVVAPALNDGEHVDLPAIKAIDKKRKEMNPIDVTMAANGKLLLNKKQVETAAMLETLRGMHEAEPQRKVLLNADSALPYAKVRDTFASLQDIGFRGVSLKVLQRKPPKGGR